MMATVRNKARMGRIAISTTHRFDELTFDVLTFDELSILGGVQKMGQLSCASVSRSPDASEGNWSVCDRSRCCTRNT